MIGIIDPVVIRTHIAGWAVWTPIAIYTVLWALILVLIVRTRTRGLGHE